MRISMVGLVGAVVVIGSCVAAAAFAQDAPPAGGRQGRAGGGQGRGGFGQGGFGQGRFGGGLSLVTVPVDVLAKELKLTDEQKTAIAAAQMKQQTEQRALFQPSADGTPPDRQAMQAKMTELNQSATKEIEAILKDKKADADTLVKSLSTLQTLRIPIQTYSDLKLTSDEKTKLVALAADVAKDRAAKMQEMQTARQAGDQAKVQELMAAFRPNGQPDEKALAALTADQKDLITKYIKDHPAPQGGPRRGGFGPGAGAAGAAPPPPL